MQKWIVAPALVALLVACEQESQTLPFDIEAAAGGNIGAGGGTVSTAAGASVQFDSGSLGGSTQVTVTPTEAPAETSQTGAANSKAFRLDPVGTQLARPASVELKFKPATDPSRAWLTTVVNVAGTSVKPVPHAHVDLAVGVVTGKIDRLGTVVAVVPASTSVFPIQSLSASLAPSPAASSLMVVPSSIGVNCGPGSTVGTPCVGTSVSATSNLLEQVEEAAVLFPSATGGFSFSGPSATGTLTASASLRILLKSGQTAESIDIIASLAAQQSSVVTETATEYRITNVVQTITGFQEGDSENASTVGTLIIAKSGADARLTIDRTFDIRTVGGVLETARIALSLPLTVTP